MCSVLRQCLRSCRAPQWPAAAAQLLRPAVTMRTNTQRCTDERPEHNHWRCSGRTRTPGFAPAALCAPSAGSYSHAVRAFQSLSSSSQAAADKPSTELTDKQIVGNLLGYVWPAGNTEFKVRVIGAVGLLLGSKLLNIQVRRRSTSWHL
jgi:hypothetical protein